MARHRSFAIPQRTDPVTFDFSGSYEEPNPEWPGPSTKEAPHKIPKTLKIEWKEEFTCLPSAPPAVSEALRGSIVQGTDGERVYQQASILEYIEGVLIDEDQERWAALMADRKRLVDQFVLIDVFQYLNGEYTTRPT